MQELPVRKVYPGQQGRKVTVAKTVRWGVKVCEGRKATKANKARVETRDHSVVQDLVGLLVSAESRAQKDQQALRANKAPWVSLDKWGPTDPVATQDQTVP